MKEIKDTIIVYGGPLRVVPALALFALATGLAGGPVCGLTAAALGLAALADLKDRIIPNTAPLFIGTLGLARSLALFLAGRAGEALSAIVGALLTIGVAVALKLIFRKGFGMGDVKLLMALGFVISFGDIVTLIVTACVLAAAAGLVSRRGLKGEMPLAPFLAVAFAMVTSLNI